MLYRSLMTRALLLGAGLIFLAAGCGDKTFPSLCAAAVPAPAGCNTACDPTPGAQTSCPVGYHCSADGKCDLQCTLTGGECGNDYSCTPDGFCIKTGGGGSNQPDAPCPGLRFTPQRTTPTVELLLDQSLSMDANYGPNNTRPTRWEAMRTALIDPTNGIVARLEDSVVFGVALYSARDQDNTTVGTCPLVNRRPRATSNFTAIQQLLQSQNPIDNTPTAESIDNVVADFNANPAANGSPKIIVLATDGLPDTCADPNPPNATRQQAANQVTVVAAQNAFRAGIKLFFLFVGNDAAGNHPQEMANAGAGLDPVTGRAPFFVATNPTELTNAFNTIIGGVVSCDLRLDSQLDPKDGPSGTVTVDGRELSFGTDWTLDNDGITIHILGNACNALKAATNPVVEAVFPCGTIIL